MPAQIAKHPLPRQPRGPGIRLTIRNMALRRLATAVIAANEYAGGFVVGVGM